MAIFKTIYKSRAVTKWVFKNKTLYNDIENLPKYKGFFLDPMRVYRYKNIFINLSLLDTLNKRVLTSVMLQCFNLMNIKSYSISWLFNWWWFNFINIQYIYKLRSHEYSIHASQSYKYSIYDIFSWIFISPVTGFPEWLSFTLIGAICAFYTFLVSGGNLITQLNWLTN